MAVTVKQLAKQERVSRQAIRARISRIPDFKKNFTTMKDHTRLVSDKGVKILHQHRDKPHKHFTIEDKHLADTKIADLTARNNDLTYQLKHDNKRAVIAQMKLNIKDLRATADDLRKDKDNLQRDKSNLQRTNRYLLYENQQLTYYKKTNWLERLLGIKRNLKKIPGSVKPVEPFNAHKSNK